MGSNGARSRRTRNEWQMNRKIKRIARKRGDIRKNGKGKKKNTASIEVGIGTEAEIKIEIRE